jgi:hypothetical protein
MERTGTMKFDVGDRIRITEKFAEENPLDGPITDEDRKLVGLTATITRGTTSYSDYYEVIADEGTPVLLLPEEMEHL